MELHYPRIKDLQVSLKKKYQDSQTTLRQRGQALRSFGGGGGRGGGVASTKGDGASGASVLDTSEALDGNTW